MSKRAERICENIKNEDIKSLSITLADAALAMKNKIDQQITIYEKLPLAQQVTTTKGEKTLKNNPATVEFRATVRDYGVVLKSLNDIVENTEAPAAVSSLDDMRKKFKVAK